MTPGCACLWWNESFSSCYSHKYLIASVIDVWWSDYCGVQAKAIATNLRTQFQPIGKNANYYQHDMSNHRYSLRSPQSSPIYLNLWCRQCCVSNVWMSSHQAVSTLSLIAGMMPACACLWWNESFSSCYWHKCLIVSVINAWRLGYSIM